jgi:hypothetical protein
VHGFGKPVHLKNSRWKFLLEQDSGSLIFGIRTNLSLEENCPLAYGLRRCEGQS